MDMPTDPPRQSRALIVLVALLQGAALYLAQRGAETGVWPFGALGVRVCWDALVLTVPTMFSLSVARIDAPRLWQHTFA